jgi:hypothetical protein
MEEKKKVLMMVGRRGSRLKWRSRQGMRFITTTDDWMGRKVSTNGLGE